MTDKTIKKSTLTTIGIDQQTNRLINKLCKRYSLKKGEIVKLAFMYMDKACINPAEAPESTKAELSKINKRQDDIIRFIRNYEEKELNPMIRVCHNIVTRFDSTVKSMEDIIISHLKTSQEKHNDLVIILGEKFTAHADAINNHAGQLSSIKKIQQRDNKKLLKLISLYSELATTGLMDGKRKENLRAEINNLIDNQ